MKTDVAFADFKKFKTDSLVFGIFEDLKLDKNLEDIDKVLNNAIKEIIKNKEFKGEFKEIKIINTLGKIGAKTTIFVGLGKRNEFDIEKLRKASGTVAKFIMGENIKKFATTLHNIEIKEGISERAQAVAEGTLLGLYQFTKFKTEKEKIKQIESFVLISHKRDQRIIDGLKKGEMISEAVNYVRDLVNMPANLVTPEKMAEEAKKIANESRLKIKVFNKRDLEKLGMNVLLAVGKGSVQEPRLIILEYNSGAKESIALVGKGITFDSGGMDIKPDEYMRDMKNDKAAASAILGVMKILPKLKIPLHVIGVIPSAENMPSGSATKPGDIVTAYNKKTVEIGDTDAEGRLILADALAYAVKNYKPHAMIDLATLTGACIVALGYEASGILGNDRRLITKIKEAGEKTYERVWELPLWDDYKSILESNVADITNFSMSRRKEAGTIAGAIFLKEFIGKTSWAHIDIAGPAYLPSDREYMPKDATGIGVRLLVQLLSDWKRHK